MAGWQPDYDPRRQRPRALEARGHLRTATWDGSALTIRALGGSVVTVPARQVASVSVFPLNLEFSVTTTGGRRYRVRYWPGQGAGFRALRDAVLGAVAAMG
jgi:hypothetical protein